MYQYAVSVHVSQIQCPEWRKALGRSKFKRIELSYSDSPTMDELSNLITAIQSDNNMNGIEITSVHFPFLTKLCAFLRCAINPSLIDL